MLFPGFLQLLETDPSPPLAAAIAAWCRQHPEIASTDSSILTRCFRVAVLSLPETPGCEIFHAVTSVLATSHPSGHGQIQTDELAVLVHQLANKAQIDHFAIAVVAAVTYQWMPAAAGNQLIAALPSSDIVESAKTSPSLNVS
mmetsp:Transcript_32632/g.70534  ORF Transcript_32632/g.70534 Transcript_32632/m.70534 type:complete len:143 (-) Transcript_32632:80-508(-)